MLCYAGSPPLYWYPVHGHTHSLNFCVHVGVASLSMDIPILLTFVHVGVASLSMDTPILNFCVHVGVASLSMNTPILFTVVSLLYNFL